MSGYTSGNNAPTLMAQAPNRKGNQSKRVPGMAGPLGATAVTSGSGGLKQPTGNQGKASAGSASPTTGRGQKVMVMRPKEYCGYAENTGYMDKDRTNYLK
jgi:hypothetical protein